MSATFVRFFSLQNSRILNLEMFISTELFIAFMLNNEMRIIVCDFACGNKKHAKLKMTLSKEIEIIYSIWATFGAMFLDW